MARARIATVQTADDPAVANLQRIDHIVVLLMENRSFDHLLGYLKLEGGRTDVEGLTADMSNMHAGKRYRVHHLGTKKFTKAQDPPHGERRSLSS